MTLFANKVRYLCFVIFLVFIRKVCSHFIPVQRSPAYLFSNMKVVMRIDCSVVAVLAPGMRWEHICRGNLIGSVTPCHGAQEVLGSLDPQRVPYFPCYGVVPFRTLQ